MRAILFLIACAPLAAEDAAMTYKAQKNDLFHCDVPAHWRAKKVSGAEGWFFTDGIRSIRAERRAGDAKALAAGLKAEEPEAASSATTVLGKKADKLSRTYRARTGGDEGAGPPEWIYEETVVAPAKAGAWVLTFQSRSPGRTSKPKGLDAWKRFLSSFKPAG